MNRRSFLAGTATAVVALSATTSLYGCDNRVEPTSTTAADTEGATWKTLACLHGCGQRCMNQALVKDGVVIRQKTDDTHEDSVEYPQQRGCLRGRCLMEFEQGTDRIKYPMKRVSWSADDPHGDLRGKEGYQRISWDEALDIVADQLKKTYTEYGPRSVFVPCSLSGSRDGYGPLLTALGGYMTVSDTVSYGTYCANTDALGLSWGGEDKFNDRLDVIENTEIFVLYGQNPGWGANGNPNFFFRAARDNGAEFICVSPTYNVSAAMLDAHWIPVRPGTDTAFLIGVAYEMLALDKEQGNVIDWSFLHKYCIGFDDESMPNDAKTKENYEGYLLGKYDGVVKDAAWASEICGTPESEIKWFAEKMGMRHDVFLSHGYAAARCNGAEDLPQAYLAIACLGGHIGKKGNCIGNLYVDRQGPGGVQIISTGDDGMDDLDLSEVKPLYDPEKVDAIKENDFIPGPEIWDAVTTGEYTSVADCWGGTFVKPSKGKIDVHLIFSCKDGSARSVPNRSKMEEALRKVDFICLEGFATTPTAPYADVILPIQANVERDLMVKDGDRDREMVLVYSKVGDSPYEAKSEQWIAEELLMRLGYDPKDVYPYSEEQRFFNRLANSVINSPDEQPSPLVTITVDDINKRGVAGKPQQGAIGIDELCKKGIYQVKRSYGDGYTHIAYKDFIDDPEKSPLESESGKFELYCQAKADTLNMIALGGETYKPYPTYHEFAGDDGYPLTMFSSHYPRSACSDFGNVPTLREVWEAPVTISVQDADELGIKTGDAVLVSSPYGKIVRTASVSPLIIPGSIDVPNGQWADFNDEGVDRGGCPNVLYGEMPRGMGVSAYNNAHVKVEKWTGDDLTLDADTQLVIECSE